MKCSKAQGYTGKIPSGNGFPYVPFMIFISIVCFEEAEKFVLWSTPLKQNMILLLTLTPAA